MGGSPNPSSILDFLINQNQGNQPPSPLAPQDSPAAPQTQQNTPAPPPAPPAQAQQSPAQAQAGGIKGYLSNIFYGMGEAAKAHLGMETDAQINLKQQALNIQQQQANASTFEKQSEAQYRQSMTAMNAPGPITDPQEAEALGLKLGDMVSPAQKFAMYKAKLETKGKTDVAQIGANARLGAAQITALSRMSQTTMKAAYMPDGTLGVGLYDKAGNFRGYADNAVVPADYLEKIHHGQEFKVDAGGILQAIPTTSTSSPLVPQPPKPNQLIQGPQAPDPKQNLQNILQNGPQQPQTPTPAVTAPKVTPGTLRNAAQAKAVTNSKPVTGSNGQPFQAPSSADVGPAYDPKSNQYVITNRADAMQSGYQNFMKSTPAQIENDRQLNNRVTDVTQKTGRYEQSFNQDLSSGDKYVISKLMSDQHFEAAFKPFGVGVTIPTGFITELDKAAQANGLSSQGVERLHAFFNQREAMSGYQRVLTGSSRGGEKNLQLQLDVVPSPLANKDVASNAFNQFRENLRIAGQGLPRMKGVQTPADIDQKFNQGGNNAPPAGAKIRDYTQLK